MINCIIVDDEPYAIQLLEKHIASFSDMHIVAKCRNAKEAISEVQTKEVDVVFLDVKMPAITGIELLESSSNHPHIILTTAYREYAIKAYELGVLDYLLKPISFVRFAKAVDRLRQVLNTNTENTVMSEPIVFKSGNEYHKVTPNEICYIKSAREYVQIVCERTNCIVRSSMGEILEVLPANKFVRVHKSYIVPLEKVDMLTATEVILSDKNRVPLGKSYVDNVRKAFSN